MTAVAGTQHMNALHLIQATVEPGSTGPTDAQFLAVFKRFFPETKHNFTRDDGTASFSCAVRGTASLEFSVHRDSGECRLSIDIQAGLPMRRTSPVRITGVQDLTRLVSALASMIDSIPSVADSSRRSVLMPAPWRGRLPASDFYSLHALRHAAVTATVEPQEHAGDPIALVTKALGRPTQERLGSRVYKTWQTPYYKLEIEEDGTSYIVYAPKAFNQELYHSRIHLTPGDRYYDEDIKDLQKIVTALSGLRREHKRILEALFNASYEQAAQLFHTITGVHIDARTIEQSLINKPQRDALKALLQA